MKMQRYRDATEKSTNVL